jgi:hypothetical protein
MGFFPGRAGGCAVMREEKKNQSDARALDRVVCNMPFQNLPTVFYR